MAAATRASSASVSSRRLRCFRIFWFFSGWSQKSGALACSSILANSAFFAGASKIAPHGLSLPAEREILSFEVFVDHLSSLF